MWQMNLLLISNSILYAKTRKPKCTSELYFIAYWKKEHNLLSFVFFLQDARFPFHMQKCYLILLLFISLYAQSTYI